MQRIMKKTIAILLSVSCLFGLNSCFKTEEDIFDQSPAQLEQVDKRLPRGALWLRERLGASIFRIGNRTRLSVCDEV